MIFYFHMVGMVFKFIFIAIWILTRLGVYLHKCFAVKAQISRKTNISEARLSLLSNSATARIYAQEFYLIALSIDADIDLMAHEVFQDAQLIAPNKYVNSTEKGIKELTNFGVFLTSRLNNQSTISKKTGIAESRLSSLSNEQTAGLLGEELYLISLALNTNPSTSWNELYGVLKLNGNV